MKSPRGAKRWNKYRSKKSPFGLWEFFDSGLAYDSR